MTSSPSSWYVNEREDTISLSAAMWGKEVHVVEEWGILFSTGAELGFATKSQGLPIPKETQGLLGAPMSHRDNQNSDHLQRTASQACQVYKQEDLHPTIPPNFPTTWVKGQVDRGAA